MHLQNRFDSLIWSTLRDTFYKPASTIGIKALQQQVQNNVQHWNQNFISINDLLTKLN